MFALLLVATFMAVAQAPQDSQLNQPPPGGGGADLMGQLRLTPEQRQKIRMIQRDTKDERASIGFRLRESNRALEDALDSETLDDNLIEQRLQAVAAAQNAQLRLRIQTEVKIRRVLNPEQLAVWRSSAQSWGRLARSTR